MYLSRDLAVCNRVLNMFNSCPVCQGAMGLSDLSLKYFEIFCNQYKIQEYQIYYLLKMKDPIILLFLYSYKSVTPERCNVRCHC